MTGGGPMQVVHVSPIDVLGGAARGAYGLHRALLDAQVDSKMLVLRKYSDDETVLTSPGARGPNILRQAVRDRLDRLPLRFYKWDPAYWWTVGWLPFDISREIESLNPDIVHFHWAGRGAAPIRLLPRIQHYPIVWTLRDMWPLTGGCHYAGECDRFRSGCGRCPQLGSRTALDISAWQWRRKHRAWRGVEVAYVAPSRWMAECALASPLRHGNKVHTIANGVDVERFKPIDRAAARAAWDLPQERRIVLFGAINSTGDPRKGFSYLIEALRMLSVRGWGKRVTAVVFGASEVPELDLGCDTRYIGQLRDDISLALLYSCADVMVVPSVQENAGKTAIEAMACGTPVVAFANSGQVEIVDHKASGYLAQNLSSGDLARGIEWCLEESDTHNALSRGAREKALACFDIRDIARRYTALYTSLLAERRARASSSEAAAGYSVDTAGQENLPASSGAGR